VHFKDFQGTFMSFFHEFSGLFNEVVMKQVRFSYTVTKCEYGVWGELKLPQWVHQTGFGVDA